MTHQDKMISKIKKCLALAKSSNAQEAANALRQAQALIRKYNVSELDIEAAQASEKATVAHVKKTPSQWEGGLASTVAKAFCCEVLLTRSLFVTEWVYIGTQACPHCQKPYGLMALVEDETVILEDPIPLAEKQLKLTCPACQKRFKLPRTIKVNYQTQSLENE